MIRVSRALFAAVLIFTAPLAKAATMSDDAASGFTGSEFGWLLHKDLLATPIVSRGDPDALALVARAMRDDDPRAGLGLQNYLKRFPRDPAAFDLAGTHLLIKDQPREAVLSLGQALKIQPDLPWTRAKYGAALYLLEQDYAARKQLARVLETDPDNPLALRWLQKIALDDGDLNAAIRYGQRSLSAFGLPQSKVNAAHVDLALLYVRAGWWEDAFDLLSPVLSAPRLDAPDQFAAGVLGTLAQVSTEIHQPVAARKALDRIAARISSEVYANPPWAILEARTLRLEGRANEAMAILDRLSSTPQAARSLIAERSMTRIDTGETDAALQDIASTISNDPAGETAQLVALYRTVAAAAGWPEGALKQLENALPSKPAPAIALELARTEAEGGAPEGARARVSALLQSTQSVPVPLRVEALQLAAGLDYAEGNRPAAIKRIRDALELTPSNEFLWLTLAAYTHDSGGHAHATADPGHVGLREILVEASEAVPDSATIWGELGILDFTSGNTESAAEMLLKAVELAPARPEINLLAALALADSGGDLDKAKALADFSRQVDPDNPATKDAAGWVAYRRDGASEASLALLNEAHEADPSDVTTQRHRAELLMELGQVDAAADAALASLSGELAAHDRETAREILLKLRPADRVVSPIRLLTNDGAGTEIGRAVFERGAERGVIVTLSGKGLPSGANPVHIHEIPSCSPGPDGTVGGAAGPHYGMDHSAHMMKDGTDMQAGEMDHSTHSHSGESAPRGDLPAASVGKEGVFDVRIDANWLTLDEVRGRSLMIHDGSKPGEPKIACAIIG